MRCFYCGKRVSLVRKRTDADFCSDEHREKYHARTRRTMEALVEDEERMAVTRRLNEGFPIRPAAPFQGMDLDDLVMRGGGSLLHFTWMPTGLPVSRAHLETAIAPSTMFAFQAAGRSEPPPPVAEPARWSFGRMQEAPRPPRPLGVSILLPEAGLRSLNGTAACDLPARQSAEPAVKLGARVERIAMLRRDMEPAARSIRARARREWLHAFEAPGSIAPPPAPPIVAALRHPRMAARLSSLRVRSAFPAHIPAPGRVEIQYVPGAAAVHPPAAAWAAIVWRELRFPSMRIDAGAVRAAREPKVGPRFVPCPEGFRRKQYYNWELLERLCGLGFGTIANHRPEIRIVAAPSEAAAIDAAPLWAAASDDRETAQPEPRRPALPFRERVSLCGAVAMWAAADLRNAPPKRAKIDSLNAGPHRPEIRSWQYFAGFAPLAGAATSRPILSGEWAYGAAEAMSIASAIRPRARTGKRTACESGIPLRAPVFSGPEFVAGRRQAGPMPESPLEPPQFAPPAAARRAERVESGRRALLPGSAERFARLRQTTILPEGCRAPVGAITPRPTVHPAFAILFGAVLPSEHLHSGAAGGLRAHAPAGSERAAFDIGRGTPRRMDREPLERFRRRAYNALRSGHTAPTWPAQSIPGLLPPACNEAQPHPPRALDVEGAEVMFRSSDRPAAMAFRRACALMDWGTLEASGPSAADWGREQRSAGVGLRVGIVLPIDPHGPIRDWGLAPAPEPEKPPEPIHEDFALGLANWICNNPDWRQDIAGVRTGSLALLRPSLGMRDYELEFLGKIENQSIGWVYRAANTSNYHAAQITVDASGAASLLRFSVVGGDREEPLAEPVPAAIARSASCRVKMTASGDEFKLFINDKPVSEWIDDRLPEGGIGFFSEAEGRARLYWVKVTPYCESPAEEVYEPPVSPRHELHRQVRMGV